MRFNIGLLRYLALAAGAFLVLSFVTLSNVAPSSLHDHIPSISSLKPWSSSPSSETQADSATGAASAKPTTIHGLWQQWSKSFESARPKASKIRLRSNAPNTPIDANDASPRTAGPDRVINPESDIEALQTAHAAFVRSLRTQELDTAIYNGTGVVTVGGGEYFGPAIVGIHMLRRTGSTLPVEVFVADESEYEDDICDNYLPKLGAKCLIITDFLSSSAPGRLLRRGPSSMAKKGEFEVTHYQLKSLAMLFCSFEQVLYLDSDSIPLVNPSTALFATEPYKSTGLVIWPDFWIASESPVFYTIAGLPSPLPPNLPQSSSEAGQLLINKRTHLKTLLLANYYNIYGPDYYYPLLSQGALGQGDKETFLAAALVLDEKWYRVHRGVDAVGRWKDGESKGSGMVQYLPCDDQRNVTLKALQASHSVNATNATEVVLVRPAFLHANTPKMNAGHLVDEGDLEDGEQRLRLWGSREEQIARFGEDLEMVVWELLVKVGCDLRLRLEEWKARDDMCIKLEAHWKAVFEKEAKEKKNNALSQRRRVRGLVLGD